MSISRPRRLRGDGAVGDAFFDGVLGDDFVEYGLLALTAAQNASEALDVLADGARAR